MFELIEAVRGRLIDPKTWDRIVWIYGTQITVRDCSQTVWVANGVIHAMDCIVICMRPEMAKIYGFTKQNDKLCFDRNSNPGFYFS